MKKSFKNFYFYPMKTVNEIWLLLKAKISLQMMKSDTNLMGFTSSHQFKKESNEKESNLDRNRD